jgi:hypothetical protein
MRVSRVSSRNCLIRPRAAAARAASVVSPTSGLGERADDEDLLAVDSDLRRAG